MVDHLGTLTVGELARRSGVTVRTLHHYDEVGVLRPQGRGDGGVRRYGADEVERLYRIRALRGLGLSLAEIGQALAGGTDTLVEIARRHIDAVEHQQLLVGRLRRRLGHLVAAAEHAGAASSDDLLEALGVMTMLAPAAQRTIPILVYAEVQQAHDHLVQVFGFTPGGVERASDGRAVHARVFAGDESEIWLHPESPEHELVSPRANRTASTGVVVIVDDVDAHHRVAVEHGARVDYPPTDQPYGLREYAAHDPEGGRWYFATPHLRRDLP